MLFLPTSLESLQVLKSYKSFKIRHNENVLSRASNAPCDQVYLAKKKTRWACTNKTFFMSAPAITNQPRQSRAAYIHTAK